MYEGFSDYDAFVDSISDGFTNWLNECLPKNRELLSNVDGYSALRAGFSGKLSTKMLRGVTQDQINEIQKYLVRRNDLKLTQKQVLQCLRGALNQSTADHALDNF